MLVTRTTNMMLQNTLLSNLSMNLSRMDKLQNQMASGRKFGHISDDPSALIYGQSARNKLAKVSHNQEMVGVAQSWLTQAEAGVMELNKTVAAVYEELVAAGGAKTDEDKRILAMVVGQLRDHYVDTLNTSYGDRYVFGGYNTPGDFAEGRPPELKPFSVQDVLNQDTGRVESRLFFNGFDVSQFDGLTTVQFNDGVVPPGSTLTADDFAVLHQLMSDVKTLDVGPGINIPITQNGLDVVFFVTRNEDGVATVRNTFDLLTEIYNAVNGIPEQLAGTLSNGDTYGPMPAVDPLGTDDLTKLIGLIQDSQNHLLTRTAEIGGRQRRLELLEARYAQDALNYEQMRSDAEDADMSEVIMYLKMAETVYQAALSAGARIIQPTLMDFLR